MVKVDFKEFEETRLNAGFFVREVVEFLGISQRTWYRWKQQNQAPIWALRALKLRAGCLDYLGWYGWYIERGVLYNRKHSPNLYRWTPSDLVLSRFWAANSDLKDRR